MLKKRVRAIGLISGGLDSLIAAKLLQDQGIEVIGMTFSSPFWDCRKAVAIGEKAGIPMKVLDIAEEHFSIVKRPVYGYGSNMNPCIDCHALMIRKAGESLDKEGADFIFTGEVVGQRPMSQRREALRTVEKLSGYEGKVLRPLSAKLLPETIPEVMGLVDRSKLLGIGGRGRKEQLKLASHYGIEEYETPGGGCLLTKEGYAKKLKVLLAHFPDASVRHAELLKHGRLFVIQEKFCLIVGRQAGDNAAIMALSRKEDIVFSCDRIPGPVGILIHSGVNCAPEIIEECAEIVASYSDADRNARINIIYKCSGETRTVEVKVLNRNLFYDRFIK